MVLTISFTVLQCTKMVRLTISIPKEFHQRVKKLLPENGFTTINDYVLDLLRHQIGVIPHQNGDSLHQNDAPQIEVKQKDKKLEVKKPGSKDSNMCKHGYLKKLCVHEECRRSA